MVWFPSSYFAYFMEKTDHEENDSSCTCQTSKGNDMFFELYTKGFMEQIESMRKRQENSKLNKLKKFIKRLLK